MLDGRPDRPLATAARLLRAGGRQVLSQVLAVAVRDLGGVSLTLRSTSAPVVLAQAGSGAGATARWVLDTPVVSTGGTRAVLTAGGNAPFTVDQADLLTAYADLLALAVDADPAERAAEAGRAVLDAEADRAQIAAALHESVGRNLVAVRYAADLATGGDPGDDLDEPIRAALTAFRVARRDLRAHSLEAGLRAALRELAVQAAGDRPADGRSALRLSVDARGRALDQLPPAVAVTVERVAQAALRGATGRAALTVHCSGHEVKLRVESAEIAYDASELDRWARRVSALGGQLRLGVDGVELDLPIEPGHPDKREGRHDDGVDLRRSPTGPRGASPDRRDRPGRRTRRHGLER